MITKISLLISIFFISLSTSFAVTQNKSYGKYRYGVKGRRFSSVLIFICACFLSLSSKNASAFTDTVYECLGGAGTNCFVAHFDRIGGMADPHQPSGGVYYWQPVDVDYCPTPTSSYEECTAHYPDHFFSISKSDVIAGNYDFHCTQTLYDDDGITEIYPNYTPPPQPTDTVYECLSGETNNCYLAHFNRVGEQADPHVPNGGIYYWQPVDVYGCANLSACMSATPDNHPGCTFYANHFFSISKSDVIAGNYYFHSTQTLYDDDEVTVIFAGSTTFGTLTPNTVLNNQVFDAKRLNTYNFNLSETSTIAILSAGPLDLKGTLKDATGNEILSNSGYRDSGSCNCLDGARQKERGHTQTNFMLRAVNLSPGSYTVEIRPENATTSIQGEFGIVFLKRPSNSEEFYAGIDALLGDQDTSNDYFDIYVKALYPEFYTDVMDIKANDNYGSTKCDGTVCRERQCKALTNFYLEQILKKSILRIDQVIQNQWIVFRDQNQDCVADDDFILKGDGDLIFHGNPQFGSNKNISRRCGTGKYCYDPNTTTVMRGTNCNIDDYGQRGDIFVQWISNGLNHYGLVYDSTNVIDANLHSDGLLRKGDNDSDWRHTANWKVARPK
jgi:hypothetical protein